MTCIPVREYGTPVPLRDVLTLVSEHLGEPRANLEYDVHVLQASFQKLIDCEIDLFLEELGKLLE